MTFENIQTDINNHEDQTQEETSPSESAGKKDSNSSDQSKTMPIFVKILLIVLIVIVALILAAEIQRRVRIMIFKNQLRHDKTSRQILLLYHQLEKAFVQKHIRYTGQTVVEYSHEIAEAYELEEEMVMLSSQMYFVRNSVKTDLIRRKYTNTARNTVSFVTVSTDS